jgi:hypothetical protein
MEETVDPMIFNLSDFAPMFMIPLMILIMLLGISIGIYISSQIKCHIRNRIFMKNIKKYDEKEKTK